MISLLDYGAGNVRSLRNAIHKLGYDLTEIERPSDILRAERLIFPGVGSFGAAMERLHGLGYIDPLRQYLSEERPFFGICIGLQSLFEGSEESPGVEGLGLIPGMIRRFDATDISVPHMGWNDLRVERDSPLMAGYGGEKLYFVHSYRALREAENDDWVLASADYGGEFISMVQRGRVAACQFHPEKSGAVGLRMLGHFLSGESVTSAGSEHHPMGGGQPAATHLAKRIIACLDVRTNDAGDLVVTKGDQYDVREEGEVRNLGKPVELARRYFEEGADEITFLNITAFRAFPLEDQPMLEVIRQTSENVFVPLTIGGGIRAFTDANGREYSALDVANEYFRSGADKVSIGGDAVASVEHYLQHGGKDGSSSIEEIAAVYGNQAVVISIDPRRVYVNSPDDTPHQTVHTRLPGPNGEQYCWFQCTVKGGREGRDVDAVQLARVCEDLGAGEIMVNSIDRDGSGAGFDLELISAVADAVTIPVIASSGAGTPAHFAEVFEATGVEAALAAGIFHRREVPIEEVKGYLQGQGIETRA